MLACPKCGFDNELGRIFCHQCGTKLDLEQIKPTSRGGKKLTRGKESPGVSRIALRVFEVAVVALIVWSVFLLVQVPSVPRIASTEQDALSIERKRIALQRLIDQNKEASIQLSAGELNAFLGKLGFEKAEGKGVKITPNSLQIQLGANEITVIVIGNLEVGSSMKKEFYLSCTGVPTIEDRHFVFRPNGAAIGALPIHPQILDSTGSIQHYLSALFRNLSEERKLLDKLTSITVNKERVLLEYRPTVAVN
jgi:hypothetical protein